MIVPPSAGSYVLYDFLKSQFDVVQYDHDTQYDKLNCLALVGFRNDHDWWKQLYQDGIRLVIDNLHEPYDHYKTFFPPLVDNFYQLNNINWFWYDEALSDRQHYGYVPAKTYKKLALMPMNQRKQHRTRLHDAMKPYLADCIYSYVALGIRLPNDCVDDACWDRYTDPDWYNDTYFSLVAETNTDSVPYRYPVQPWPFMTEKTMKPLSYRHPYMIYGQSGTLAHLRAIGFESFENLFNESYDQIGNPKSNQPDPKLYCIMDNVKNFERRPYDALTLGKIEHNYHHFFDRQLIRQRVDVEIVQPLLEYVNDKT